MTEPVTFKVKLLDVQDGPEGAELVVIPQGMTGSITIAISPENELYLYKKFQSRVGAQ